MALLIAVIVFDLTQLAVVLLLIFFGDSIVLPIVGILKIDLADLSYIEENFF